MQKYESSMAILESDLLIGTLPHQIEIDIWNPQRVRVATSFGADR